MFVVYFLYPETANRTLEDLDAYFDRDSGHGIIIPINAKAAKSTRRPQEAIDAENARVAMAENVDSKAQAKLSVEHEENTAPLDV